MLVCYLSVVNRCVDLLLMIMTLFVVVCRCCVLVSIVMRCWFLLVVAVAGVAVVRCWR